MSRDLTGIALGVAGCLVDHAGHGGKLFFQDLKGVFLVFDQGNRLHLACDAAHFLAALNRGGVPAVCNVAGLGTGNTADVVAHMSVADLSVVFTAADHTAAETGNAADVGNGVGRFGAGQRIQCDIRNIHGILLGGGIDPGVVHTAADDTLIFTGETAYEMVAVDLAGYGAVFDDAGNGIDACDAADPVRTGKTAAETAVENAASVVACDGTDLIAAAAGVDPAFQMQILDHSPFCKIPEKTLGGAIRRKAQAGDGVALAVKGTAENGDALKFHTGKIQIPFQGHQDVLAVTVQTAVFHQIQNALLRGQTQFQSGFLNFLFFFVLFCLGADRNCQVHKKQQAQKAAENSFNHVHCLLPGSGCQWIRMH